ncbi:MAG: thioredoxin [Saprospiraceae bacterium]|nr:thioredoxin [Candidatus Vicinibacter proximus]MBL7822554.1 thioredoxin [Saprospiraceae bacterium]MCC6844369.1 thioredoxin [Saprospiraceae bacterium]HRG33651.1 thioredoxin [Saprospiraceae bacterium]
MSNNFKEIIQSSKPTLVDFYADWCGPCKMQGPILKEFKNKVGDRVAILKIDVDKNPAVSQHYKIRSIPTLMLFKNGQAVWTQSGVASEATLEQVLKKFE